jgi:hypothetical protein
MSDYTKIYDGASYDSTEAVLSGAVFDTEFTAISVAVNSKLDKVGTSDLDFNTTASLYKIVNVSSSVDYCSLRMTTDGDMGFYDEVDSTYYLRFSQAQDTIYAYRPINVTNSITLDTSSAQRNYEFNAGAKLSYFYGGTNGDVGLYDSTNARVIWSYDESANQLITNATTLVTGNAVLNGSVTGTGVKDEDNMASDSATAVATQQSIKAYVDSKRVVSGKVVDPTGITHQNGPLTLTYSKIGTGHYRLTHNNGSNAYGGAVSPMSITALHARFLPGTTAVDIYLYDSSHAPVNGNFSFIIDFH